MATFSYSRDGKHLIIRTLTPGGTEMPLAFCASGFSILGLIMYGLGEPLLGLMTGALGVVSLGILMFDTRVEVLRSGELHVLRTLVGLRFFQRRFAAGSWRVNVVAGDEWAEDLASWNFVIQGEQRVMVPYAFPKKQGAVRVKQRVLAFLDDSPF